jgi:hypothetical protein
MTTMNTVEKKQFWLMAEPNWNYFGLEYGGLMNRRYDEIVRVYCDLETKATVAVTTISSEESLGLEQSAEADYSWAGYQWDDDGACWRLSCGEEADYCWWMVDDLLWGAFEECYLSAVHDETHCVIDIEGIIDYYVNRSHKCMPMSGALSTIEYWWGELSAEQMDKYGFSYEVMFDEEVEHRKIIEEWIGA